MLSLESLPLLLHQQVLLVGLSPFSGYPHPFRLEFFALLLQQTSLLVKKILDLRIVSLLEFLTDRSLASVRCLLLTLGLQQDFNLLLQLLIAGLELCNFSGFLSQNACVALAFLFLLNEQLILELLLQLKFKLAARCGSKMVFRVELGFLAEVDCTGLLLLAGNK